MPKEGGSLIFKKKIDLDQQIFLFLQKKKLINEKKVIMKIHMFKVQLKKFDILKIFILLQENF